MFNYILRAALVLLLASVSAAPITAPPSASTGAELISSSFDALGRSAKIPERY